MDNEEVFSFIAEYEIRNRVERMGFDISEEYKDKPLLLLGVLKGAFVFLSDLCRAINIPCEIAFLRASSYGNDTKSSGKVEIKMDTDADISKYHVLIVDDIVDTGLTLKKIKAAVKRQKPLSVKTAVFLDKPDRREVKFTPDYYAFSVPDYFVVGYGMDYAEKYRNLPYVGVLHKRKNVRREDEQDKE